MKTKKTSYLAKELNKAKKKYYLFEKKVSNPVMKAEFKHRCIKKFEELILEGNVNFSSFYKQCFHGIYVDLLRKGPNYSRTCSLEEVPTLGNSPTMLKFLQSSQENELIDNSLHLLPPEEQFVILLNVFLMMPLESISRLIGKDQSTYSRTRCKAKRIIKESIEKELENETSEI